MKKLILILMFSTQIVHAQWGANFGLTFAQFSSDGPGSATENFSSSAGLNIGLLYDYKLQENLLLSTEVSYTTYNGSVTDSSVPIEIDVNYAYINLKPTLLYFLENNLILSAGGLLGFNTKAEASLMGIKIDYDSVEGVEINEFFALRLGIGYDTTIEGKKIRPKIEYQIALNDAIENNDGYTASANSINIGLDIIF